MSILGYDTPALETQFYCERGSLCVCVFHNRLHLVASRIALILVVSACFDPTVPYPVRVLCGVDSCKSLDRSGAGWRVLTAIESIDSDTNTCC
jgi:hypothetical protein